jgi:hypothetical protein
VDCIASLAMARLVSLVLLLPLALTAGCAAVSDDDLTAPYVTPDGELIPPEDGKEDSPTFAALERALIDRDQGVINNLQLSYRSTLKLAVSEGIACDIDAVTITAIARQESTFRVTIVGPENDNGTRDYGVWQINSATANQFGYKTSQLRQPQVNADAMSAIRAAQGLNAWAAYKLGRYTKFVKYAQEALDSYHCE